jgi:hypothetical protein
MGIVLKYGNLFIEDARLGASRQGIHMKRIDIGSSASWRKNAKLSRGIMDIT